MFSGLSYDISLFLILCAMKSDSTFYLAGTQAACANVDMFYLTLNNSANTLDVRLPGTFCLQVGVADVVARKLTLSANFTYMCQCVHLLEKHRTLRPHTQYKYSIII